MKIGHWGITPFLKAIVWWWKEGHKYKAVFMFGKYLLPAIWFSVRVSGLEGSMQIRRI